MYKWMHILSRCRVFLWVLCCAWNWLIYVNDSQLRRGTEAACVMMMIICVIGFAAALCESM